MKLAIFDCDGTLVDSQHLIVSAMTSAFIGVGRAPLPRSEVLAIVGLSLPLAIEMLAPDASRSELEALTDGYRSAFAELRGDPSAEEPMFDGVLELIQWLGEHDDVALAIATGKSRRGVDRLLERHRLEDRFAVISTADEHPSKPHPSMITHALAAACVEPENAVMIGDTTYDIAMARAAGVDAVAVAWGYHAPDELSRSGAIALVSTAGELSQLLARKFALAERS